jgi:hypothetical protein
VAGALLAICEPSWQTSERLLWTLGPIAIVLIWVALMFRLLWRSPDQARGPMLLLWALCAILGPVIFLFPEGVQGDQDFLLRFELSVAVAVVLGLLASLRVRSVGPAKLVGIAILGDIAVPGLLVLLFAFGLAASGSCID